MTMLFVEDVLEKFIDICLGSNNPFDYLRAYVIDSQDYLILTSFHAILRRGDSLTRSQGNLLLRLLEKHKGLAVEQGFDYSDFLLNPAWRSDFRSVDLTKKISVARDEDGMDWVELKFPYRLKANFENEVEKNLSVSSRWDHKAKKRKISLYDANVFDLYDFAVRYNFEIDQSFLDALGMIEEIFNQQDQIRPTATIVDGCVQIKTTLAEVREHWDLNRTNDVDQDLLLAKHMGLILDQQPISTMEKIAAAKTNHFWQESIKDFLRLIKTVDQKTCILLDRIDNPFEWLKNFVKEADLAGFSTGDIKICFRKDREEDDGFNQWVKDSGYGGSVETGKILIFKHKPAKWVFKDPNSIKIVATNNYYPHIDPISKDWLNSHPCVIYIGYFKPSKAKEQQIVKL